METKTVLFKKQEQPSNLTVNVWVGIHFLYNFGTFFLTHQFVAFLYSQQRKKLHDFNGAIQGIFYGLICTRFYRTKNAEFTAGNSAC